MLNFFKKSIFFLFLLIFLTLLYYVSVIAFESIMITINNMTLINVFYPKKFSNVLILLYDNIIFVCILLYIIYYFSIFILNKNKNMFSFISYILILLLSFITNQVVLNFANDNSFIIYMIKVSNIILIIYFLFLCFNLKEK